MASSGCGHYIARVGRWQHDLLLGSHHVPWRSAVCRVALLVLCTCMTGSAFTDYSIHVHGAYWILRIGRNPISLVRECPPVTGSKGRSFEYVYSGVKSYGCSNGIIYGTTSGGGYYISNPPSSVVTYDDRDKWADALGSLGVHETTLIVPSPSQDEEQGFPEVGWALAWCVGIFFLPIIGIIVVLALLGLGRKRKSKQGCV